MGLRVLLVDDSRDVQAALSSLLQSTPGVRVVGCADDGATAMAQLASSHPDLVVLDVELARGERGYDVLQRMQALRPGLPVLVLSNQSGPAMRSHFLNGGAQAYFDKALDFDGAIAWIRARAATAGPGADATH